MGRVLELPQPSLGRRGNLLTVTPARVLSSDTIALRSIETSAARIVSEASTVRAQVSRLLSLAKSVVRRRSVAVFHGSNHGGDRCENSARRTREEFGGGNR